MNSPEYYTGVQQREAILNEVEEVNTRAKAQESHWEDIEGISDTEESAQSDDLNDIHFYEMMIEAAKFLRENKINFEPGPKIRLDERRPIENIDIEMWPLKKP